jgi:hypothetical protein
VKDSIQRLLGEEDEDDSDDAGIVKKVRLQQAFMTYREKHPCTFEQFQAVIGTAITNLQKFLEFQVDPECEVTNVNDPADFDNLTGWYEEEEPVMWTWTNGTNGTEDRDNFNLITIYVTAKCEVFWFISAACQWTPSGGPYSLFDLELIKKALTPGRRNHNQLGDEWWGWPTHIEPQEQEEEE